MFFSMILLFSLTILAFAVFLLIFYMSSLRRGKKKNIFQFPYQQKIEQQRESNIRYSRFGIEDPTVAYMLYLLSSPKEKKDSYEK